MRSGPLSTIIDLFNIRSGHPLLYRMIDEGILTPEPNPEGSGSGYPLGWSEGDVLDARLAKAVRDLLGANRSNWYDVARLVCTFYRQKERPRTGTIVFRKSGVNARIEMLTSSIVYEMMETGQGSLMFPVPYQSAEGVDRANPA